MLTAADLKPLKQEYWINFYAYGNGETWEGFKFNNRYSVEKAAKQAIANGSKILYRIHVILK